MQLSQSLSPLYDHPVLFQVIRRGDRRPFYAPARYVMEVKSDQARLQVGECDVDDNLAVVHVDGYVNVCSALYGGQI